MLNRLIALVLLLCCAACVPSRTQSSKDGTAVADSSEVGPGADVTVDNSNPADSSAETDSSTTTDGSTADAGLDTTAVDSDVVDVTIADLSTPDSVTSDSSADVQSGEVTQPGGDLALQGVLGIAPTSGYTSLGHFEVRNDLDLQRELEIAYSSIPLAQSSNVTDLTKLMVVDDKGMWIQAQFRALSYWGTPFSSASPSSAVRWLQITLPVRTFPESSRNFELRYVDGQMPTATDALAVTVSGISDGQFTVNTGAASFSLNAWNPALITSITAFTPQGARILLTHQAGYGPRLSLSSVELMTAASYAPGSGGEVFVDVFPSGIGGADARISESGPVRVVVRLRGTFKHEASKCADGSQRFRYTAEFAFTRGRADVDLRVNLRNRCGNSIADTGTTPNTHSFSDESFSISGFSWWFGLNLESNTKAYYSLDTIKVRDMSLGTASAIHVAQEKGQIQQNKWSRVATVTLKPGNTTEETLPTAKQPFVGLSDSQSLIGATLGWMRYREPMALTVTENAVALRFVGSDLQLGEAKAIWGQGKLSIQPAPPNPLAVRSLRDRMLAEVERGLLLRRPISEFNATKVLPLLGTEFTTTSLKTLFSSQVNLQHTDTVKDDNGQWSQALTYGSQLWPDIQEQTNIDFSTNSPFVNTPSLNLGDPGRTEFLEFYRTGDPRYVWDFAMPQAYLMAYTAWFNTGDREQDNNGLGLSDDNTPAGEGNWHRTAALDSYDYARTENGAIMHAYVIRPNSLLQERIAQSGLAVPHFYSEPRKSDEWWKVVTPGRTGTDQAMNGINLYQALTHLANCAEFVANPVGKKCSDKLNELMGELINDNLSYGVLCSGEDKPELGAVSEPYAGTGCLISGFESLLDQGLMVYWRYATTLNPSSQQTINTALTGTLALWYNTLPRKNAAIDPSADWSPWFGCTITETLFTDCAMITPESSFSLEQSQRLQFLGILLLSKQLGGFNYCDEIKPLLLSGDIPDRWSELFQFHVGWDAQTAGHMLTLPYIVGALDDCP